MNVLRPTHDSSQVSLFVSFIYTILGQWATQTYRDQVAASWLGVQNEDMFPIQALPTWKLDDWISERDALKKVSSRQNFLSWFTLLASLDKLYISVRRPCLSINRYSICMHIGKYVSCIEVYAILRGFTQSLVKHPRQHALDQLGDDPHEVPSWFLSECIACRKNNQVNTWEISHESFPHVFFCLRYISSLPSLPSHHGQCCISPVTGEYCNCLEIRSAGWGSQDEKHDEKRLDLRVFQFEGS